MTISRSFSREDIVAISAALLVVCLLFCIDEGYNDFRWMKSWGNWFMFLIYSGGLVLGEYLISKILSERFQGAKRVGVIVAAGLPLGLGIVLGSIYGLAALVQIIAS